MVKMEEIQGRHIFEIFPDNPSELNPMGVNNLKESLERVLKTKKSDALAVQKYDIRLPENEGGHFEERYWSAVNSPILNDEDEVIYIVHRAEDITEFIKLKQLEQAEKALTIKLQTKAELVEIEIFQRAQQIQEANKLLRLINDELEEKNRALIRSNKELEAFSSSVAHDLRNPLSVIKGVAVILQENHELDYKGRQYLHRILLAENKMEHLITDLLKFSHVLKIDLKKEEFDLSKLVEKVAKNIQDMYPQRKIKWMIQKKIKAEGDQNLLQIVVENLLSNAIKYSSKTPQPIVQFGAIDQEGEIIYYIQDNGIGFNQEEADKLFLPFSRLSTSTDFTGTGIGLSTVKRIIERHNGKIWAEGVKGEGAKFFFSLPNPMPY